MFYRNLIHPKTYDYIPLNSLYGKYLLNYYILKGGNKNECPKQFLAQMDPATQIRDFYYNVIQAVENSEELLKIIMHFIPKPIRNMIVNKMCDLTSKEINALFFNIKFDKTCELLRKLNEK